MFIVYFTLFVLSVIYKRDGMIVYGITVLPRTKRPTHISFYKSSYIHHRKIPKTNLI